MARNSLDATGSYACVLIEKLWCCTRSAVSSGIVTSSTVGITS